MTIEEIRERDNRAALATGRQRTIGDDAGVQSLLMEDVQANAAGRVSDGLFEERWVLKCLLMDLTAKPLPQQNLYIDEQLYIVESCADVEGMLDIHLKVRRA